MKVIYNKESAILSIILRSGRVAESDEAPPGVILDYPAPIWPVPGALPARNSALVKCAR
jgi:hypothetical protein